jgi:hypothetical protein
MWQVILDALMREVQAHPERILNLVEQIVALLNKHPEAVAALIKQLPKTE